MNKDLNDDLLNDYRKLLGELKFVLNRLTVHFSYLNKLDELLNILNENEDIEEIDCSKVGIDYMEIKLPNPKNKE